MCIFIRKVREAFVASVKCDPVNFHKSQESTVPNISLSSFAALETSGTFSKSHFILNALKYEDIGRPVLFYSIS